MHHSRNTIASDEDAQDPLWRQGTIFSADAVDEHGEDGVDACGEQDGGGDDEEVLQDEEYEAVGVDVGGEGAADVACYFEEEGDGDGEEVEGAVAVDLVAVGNEGEGEEDGGEEGEGEGGGVAV